MKTAMSGLIVGLLYLYKAQIPSSPLLLLKRARSTRRLTCATQLAHAGYCPTCDPKNPKYFQETEQFAACVCDEATDGDGEKSQDWEVALPNDHIWSGAKDGQRLKNNIDPKRCKVRDFEAAPVDEFGTVDIFFMADSSCQVSAIQEAFSKTTRDRQKIECVKMGAGPASLGRG